ncbi:kinase-like protein [Xylona heveae TC161]|uniref:non-specific serine/threonine protein kinase n=1 Tax=Xylona heveae (strain CBS 132557 / TC161) TaxID=1328760 RepID=A0A164ZEI3_XYLHT|nr:kinase-like protein [Xylona heveae TC161]KZF19001.1 kinase-like protein [Xylona heveae TC161]
MAGKRGKKPRRIRQGNPELAVSNGAVKIKQRARVKGKGQKRKRPNLKIVDEEIDNASEEVELLPVASGARTGKHQEGQLSKFPWNNLSLKLPPLFFKHLQETWDSGEYRDVIPYYAEQLTLLDPKRKATSTTKLGNILVADYLNKRLQPDFTQKDTSSGWRPLRMVHESGNGVVVLWKKQKETDSKAEYVAVKDTRFPRWFQDYSSEAKLTHRLNEIGCPNVVKVLDWCSVDPSFNGMDLIRIVYEYYPLGSLHDLYAYYHKRSYFVFPEAFLWQVFHQVSTALCWLVRGTTDVQPRESWEEIIHHDLKPANIFLAPPDESTHFLYPVLKLADFGLAYTVPNETIRKMKFGAEWRGAGTDGYIPPEFLDLDEPLAYEQPPGSHTDIFSLGQSVSELAFLAQPINIQELTDGVPPIWTALSDFYSDQLRSLIRSCTELDSRNRPSAYDLFQETQMTALSWLIKTENVINELQIHAGQAVETSSEFDTIKPSDRLPRPSYLPETWNYDGKESVILAYMGVYPGRLLYDKSDQKRFEENESFRSALDLVCFPMDGLKEYGIPPPPIREAVSIDKVDYGIVLGDLYQYSTSGFSTVEKGLKKRSDTYVQDEDDLSPAVENSNTGKESHFWGTGPPVSVDQDDLLQDVEHHMDRQIQRLTSTKEVDERRQATVEQKVGGNVIPALTPGNVPGEVNGKADKTSKVNGETKNEIREAIRAKRRKRRQEKYAKNKEAKARIKQGIKAAKPIPTFAAGVKKRKEKKGKKKGKKQKQTEVPESPVQTTKLGIPSLAKAAEGSPKKKPQQKEKDEKPAKRDVEEATKKNNLSIREATKHRPKPKKQKQPKAKAKAKVKKEKARTDSSDIKAPKAPPNTKVRTTPMSRFPEPIRIVMGPSSTPVLFSGPSPALAALKFINTSKGNPNSSQRTLPPRSITKYIPHRKSAANGSRSSLAEDVAAAAAALEQLKQGQNPETVSKEKDNLVKRKRKHDPEEDEEHKHDSQSSDDEDELDDQMELEEISEDELSDESKNPRKPKRKRARRNSDPDYVDDSNHDDEAYQDDYYLDPEDINERDLDINSYDGHDEDPGQGKRKHKQAAKAAGRTKYKGASNTVKRNSPEQMPEQHQSAEPTEIEPVTDLVPELSDASSVFGNSHIYPEQQQVEENYSRQSTPSKASSIISSRANTPVPQRSFSRSYSPLSSVMPSPSPSPSPSVSSSSQVSASASNSSSQQAEQPTRTSQTSQTPLRLRPSPVSYNHTQHTETGDMEYVSDSVSVTSTSSSTGSGPGPDTASDTDPISASGSEVESSEVDSDIDATFMNNTTGAYASDIDTGSDTHIQTDGLGDGGYNTGTGTESENVSGDHSDDSSDDDDEGDQGTDATDATNANATDDDQDDIQWGRADGVKNVVAKLRNLFGFGFMRQ